MTIARRKQIHLDITPFYHCITRCVRRAFLCGKDIESGKTFEHRKDWIEKHLLLLSEVFCIDIAGYAVMSNHYHLVLHVDQKRATELSDADVLSRWLKIYKGPTLIQRYVSKETLTKEESGIVLQTIATWRYELTNISRFMGHLNQTISRRANREDGCRGRFWESRFKLQAILDVKALLRTLCYVDLNPLRAGIATLPESSAYTSIKRRVKYLKSGLMRFHASATESPDVRSTQSIPISFKEYLELLDFTGREVRKGKHGFVEAEQPSILSRLNYSLAKWGKAQQSADRPFSKAIGEPEAIQQFCEAAGQRWIWNSGE